MNATHFVLQAIRFMHNPRYVALHAMAFIHRWLHTVQSYECFAYLIIIFNFCIRTQTKTAPYYTRKASCFSRLSDPAKCHPHIVRIKLERTNCACIFYRHCAPSTIQMRVWMPYRANNLVHTTPAHLGAGARVCAKGKIDSTNSFTFIYLNSKRKQNEIEGIVLPLDLPWNNCKHRVEHSHANTFTHTHKQQPSATDRTGMRTYVRRIA